MLIKIAKIKNYYNRQSKQKDSKRLRRRLKLYFISILNIHIKIEFLSQIVLHIKFFVKQQQSLTLGQFYKIKQHMEQDQEQSIFDKLKYTHIDVNRSLYLIRQLDQKMCVKKVQLNKKQNNQLKKAAEYLEMAKNKKFNANIVFQINKEMQSIAKLQTQVYGLAKQKVQIAQILVQKLTETQKLTQQQCTKLQIKLNMEPGSVIQLCRKKQQEKKETVSQKKVQNQEEFQSIQKDQQNSVQYDQIQSNKINKADEKKTVQKQQKVNKKKPKNISKKPTSHKKSSQSQKQNQEENKQKQKLKSSQIKQDTTQKIDQNQQIKQKSPDKQKYCYCGQACYGEMVLCQSNFCLKEWFHRECIQDIELPQKWICKQCKQSNQESMKKKFVRDFVDFQFTKQK